MKDMRRGTYWVPGDTRTYVLPQDATDLDEAWDRYLGGKTEPEDLTDRRGTPEDVDPEVTALRKARHDEAMAYVAGYVGTWGFIKDLHADRRWGTKWMRLSERQVEVVLRAKARDAERIEERKRDQTGRDLTVLPYGRTYAAVDNDEGGVTFLTFDRPEELDRFKQPNKWHGWVFVKQYLGGHGEQMPRLGSQRPGETYSGQWPTLIDRVLADVDGAVRRFGLELGICGVCGRDLTNEESRELGIGPVCRGKLRSN